MKISNTGLHIDTTEVNFLPGDMIFDIDASMFSGVYIRPKKAGLELIPCYVVGDLQPSKIMI